MSDFIIGLDLDGVVYQWDSTARYMLRQHIDTLGRTVPTELFFPSVEYNSIQNAISPGDWKWLWTDAISEGLYRYGHVVQGAMAGVKMLTNLGDVVVITSRPQAAVNDTLGWMGFMFNRAALSGIVIQSNGQRKSEVLPTPHVYIDDMPHIVTDVLDNTASSVILYDQPWNASYEMDTAWQSAQLRRLVRAKNWPQVIRIVRRIKEATR